MDWSLVLLIYSEISLIWYLFFFVFWIAMQHFVLAHKFDCAIWCVERVSSSKNLIFVGVCLSPSHFCWISGGRAGSLLEALQVCSFFLWSICSCLFQTLLEFHAVNWLWFENLALMVPLGNWKVCWMLSLTGFLSLGLFWRIRCWFL